MKFLLVMNWRILKEVKENMFNEDSSLVGSCILMIGAGLMSIEEIPNIYNLREEVLKKLTK